jgi:CubicO group peptidase (beta-lactamase class C family)
MADERADRITVRQLLNQTSGLSDTTVNIDATQSATSLAGSVATLSTGRPAADPGARFEYCNVNYDVATRLVEVVSDQSFEDYLTRNVFEPLRMTDSAASDRAVHPSDGYNSLCAVRLGRHRQD